LRAGLLIAVYQRWCACRSLVDHSRFPTPLIPLLEWHRGNGVFSSSLLSFFRGLRSTTERWAILARTDPLTGVLKPKGVRRGRLSARWPRRALSPVAFTRLSGHDDFKKVNDEGGHEDGDRLLVVVAETLARNLRAFDVVARYGGDEFVLLLPEAGDKAAEMVLDKLMGALPRCRAGPLAARASSYRRHNHRRAADIAGSTGPAGGQTGLRGQAGRKRLRPAPAPPPQWNQ